MRYLFRILQVVLACSAATLALSKADAAAAVRLKDLARIQGAHDESLIGYGLVAGLAGSGDSSRNRATMQSLANTLTNFGVHVSDSDLNGRNTAAVMLTATLNPFAETGDHADVQVASLGDARSLAGGTLLMTPLYGPDQKLYALAQGSLAVGGFSVEASASSIQKNFPTVGRIPRGAIIERPAPHAEVGETTSLSVILNAPDYTTAQRAANAIAQTDKSLSVHVVHPGRIQVSFGGSTDVMSLIARLEAIRVVPDYDARVVVNERTGTVVAGSNVTIGQVSIAHGDLQIEVVTNYLVSQPSLLTNAGTPNPNIGTAVVPNAAIRVTEGAGDVVELKDAATVGDLVRALQRIHLATRDVISILQAIREAGALHAELIIQ
jgi:flagellar P-ring protein precursor FlgI